MTFSHPFQAIFNKDSKVLILGSFPSIKSRESNFYYANPQNRFWDILGIIFNENIPKLSKKTPKEKYSEVFQSQIDFLLRHNIAIWDIVKICNIDKSSDATLNPIKINEIERLCEDSRIRVIFTNGKKATEIYKKYCNNIKLDSFGLPSSSSANARYSIESLGIKWQIIKQYL
ncbi:DNA-deoxyinosine glycosylase [Helicobacter sp. 16-1353]|uniref:DNA-deoxyinosine glycosylase n=1 Tax=Helicobacter sp. 16-1353 TaxID=2004996 RepID=UPI000DCD44C2|nr:DNA-deoxyinosine glycosylase [Helicobacter sp. 16-1353]RAX55229.1 DNA-deoxyinosine glycosylase [Helicobacter sp. 16-1353]